MVVQPITQPGQRATRNAQRETQAAQRATLLGILALLGLLAIGRLLLTAFGYGVPAWFDEELNPLIGLISQGQPITQIDCVIPVIAADITEAQLARPLTECEVAFRKLSSIHRTISRPRTPRVCRGRAVRRHLHAAAGFPPAGSQPDAA